MLEEKITLDKLIRWVVCGLIIFAVFFITNSMSEVLLPFFVALFHLLHFAFLSSPRSVPSLLF